MSTSDIVTIIDLLKQCTQQVFTWFYDCISSCGFVSVILFILVFGLIFRFVISRSMPGFHIFSRGSDSVVESRTYSEISPGWWQETSHTETRSHRFR